MKNKIGKVLSRFKYVVALIIFIILIVFVGENSLIKRLGRRSEISALTKQLAEEENNYKKDSIEYYKLQTDPGYVHLIAREKYYMRNEGEDIFIINDKK